MSLPQAIWMGGFSTPIPLISQRKIGVHYLSSPLPHPLCFCCFFFFKENLFLWDHFHLAVTFQPTSSSLSTIYPIYRCHLPSITENHGTRLTIILFVLPSSWVSSKSMWISYLSLWLHSTLTSLSLIIFTSTLYPVTSRAVTCGLSLLELFLLWNLTCRSPATTFHPLSSFIFSHSISS